MLVIHKGNDKMQELLMDYYAYIDTTRRMIIGIRSTMDAHMNQAFQEKELPNKLIHEAAAWHAFEYVRCYYKRTANFV
jgi:hypothetical protein